MHCSGKCGAQSQQAYYDTQHQSNATPQILKPRCGASLQPHRRRLTAAQRMRTQRPSSGCALRSRRAPRARAAYTATSARGARDASSLGRVASSPGSTGLLPKPYPSDDPLFLHSACGPSAHSQALHGRAPQPCTRG